MSDFVIDAIGTDGIKKLAEFSGSSYEYVKQAIEEDDWSWWRRLEEKVMEDDSLFVKYCSAIHDVDTYESVFVLAKADLPTRCKALVSVLPNNK